MSASSKPQILLDQVRTRGGLHHISRRKIRPYSAVHNRAYTPLSKVGTLLSIIVLRRGFSIEAQYRIRAIGCIVQTPECLSESQRLKARVHTRRRKHKEKKP